MGCPLSPAEETILNGKPLSGYEQDILDNLPPAPPEWLSQIGWLATHAPQENSGIRHHKQYAPSPRDLAAAAKREKVLEWMEGHGGMISVEEAIAVYGGKRTVIYHAMNMLLDEGRIVICCDRPRVWGLPTNNGRKWK